MTPLKRLYSMLELDRKDVMQIFAYAIIAGLISLSLPLGIQSIINFLQSGRVSASLVVLIIIVVIGVALGGLMSLMQLRITENLQQKIFIRSSFEFAARLPKIKFTEIYKIYPPELANRFFDTLAIQKGISKLLLDFSAAILQITFGMILLSLYHPYFLLFGILLSLLLYLIFKFSYKRGLNTSMYESKYKYKVAGWLQEIARNNYSFKKYQHFCFAMEKNDKLTDEYLMYREKHFKVIQSQYSQLIVFKIIITAGLLLVGGYLVMNRQMNIGQFVAAEIIILLVISSVEKIVIGLETFYDVLTSVEKIGQVTDMEMEEQQRNEVSACYTEIQLQAEDMDFRFPGTDVDTLRDINLQINQGEKIFLEGNNGSGKTTLIRVLAGILRPTGGALFINDDTYKKIDLQQYRNSIETIVQRETFFEGSILENITFRDKDIKEDDLKYAIEAVKLKDLIKSLPDGLDTMLIPDGKQFSSSNAQKILIARSIVRKPLVLFYEDPTDTMDEPIAKEIIDFIMDKKNRWTVIVTSKNQYWKSKATRVVSMSKGEIINDQKLV
ncbi:ABC transporter ATP-binding protein [Flavobacterium sp.]|uniref:peptidase domain-containing ABC transporter n=1 Tax=Flavobacterium sp. TaxID=239 RepID=UPI00262D1538|nr:ABC transporter ATP-binding protein [Flavobacterium sp.]